MENYNGVQYLKDDVTGIITLYPTQQQVQNFQALVEKFEEWSDIKSVGAFKIVCPPECIPRKSKYEDLGNLDIAMEYSRRQVVSSSGEGFQSMAVPIEVCSKRKSCGKTKSVHKLKHYEETLELGDLNEGLENSRVSFGQFYRISVRARDTRIDEEDFWDHIALTKRSPSYATGDGSLFDVDTISINLNKLDTVLQQRTVASYGHYPGITESWIYIGQAGSHFAFHIEDSFLLSVNYLHDGAPKRWYVVPASEGFKLQDLAAKIFPEEAQACKYFLRHKIHLIPPNTLSKYNIRYHKIEQKPGEYIVLLPFTYHEGFNEGLNVSEAVNFATEGWMKEYIGCFEQCTCGNPEAGVQLPCDQFFQVKNEKQYRRMCGSMYPKFIAKCQGSTPCDDDKANCSKSTRKIVRPSTLSVRSVSDFMRTEQHVQQATGSKIYNICPYCLTKQNQLKSHIMRSHSLERSVQSIVKADKDGDHAKAKQLVNDVKAEGIAIFNHNRDLNPDGEFWTFRQPTKTRNADDYITCIKCKKILLLSEKRHKCYSTCEEYQNTTVRERRWYSQIHENQFNSLLSSDAKEVLVTKNQDCTWQYVIGDDIISVLINQLVTDKLSEENIMRYSRLLATIVIDAQKTNEKIVHVKDLFTSESQIILQQFLTDESNTSTKKKGLRTVLKRLVKIIEDSSIREQIKMTAEEFTILKSLCF